MPDHPLIGIYGGDGERRWHAIWDDNPIILRPGDPREHVSVVNGPNARPYIVYPFTAESGWTFNQEFRCRDHVAKIYLTIPEVALGAQLRRTYGPYVLIEPWSKHANLRWPLEYWQSLVAARPDLTFIQHVHKGTGNCIVDGVPLVDTRDFRQACALLASASLYIRGESGMCHAAAALGVEQITIWGGCMDAEVMGYYRKQHMVGVTPPFCGRYIACTHCRGVMQDILPSTVLAELASIRVD